MEFSHFATSNVGLKRDHNEDSILVDEPLGLYLLSDGMGGHAAGEVASKLAVETIHHFFKNNVRTTEEQIDSLKMHFPEGTPLPGKKLIYAIMSANNRIMAEAGKNRDHLGMGATLVALHTANGIIHLGHVGDSRIYLFRKGLLRRLTEDHSVLNEELKRRELTPAQIDSFPYKNMLARAMGYMEKAKVDFHLFHPRKDDLFLLCSDGLTDMVNDGDIADTIADKMDDLEVLGNTLVEKANKNGGVDNISLVLVKASSN